MKESDFFENISTRVGRQDIPFALPSRTEVGVPDFWRDYVLNQNERRDVFCESLEKLGGHIQVCATAEALYAYLQSLLRILSPQRIATWALAEITNQGLPRQQLMDVLQPYQLLEWGEPGTVDVADAEVGLTGCSFAVADTGTLVLTSSPARGRSVSLLPSVHIAIVRSSQIRTRLGEVMQALSQMEDMPSYVHFISGPSRSSDIENDQSIGVHGPAAVYVAILDDPASGVAT